MTLVYERAPAAKRVTHALLIGCGRFHPNAVAKGFGPRPQTVAGVREVMRFLIDHADRLEAPLATVECLLSDPTVEGQAAAGLLDLGTFDHDPRRQDLVEAATAPNVEAAAQRWTNRCTDGDHLFFYISSHGVADRGPTALALLEDTFANPKNPLSATLNFSIMANGLCATAPGPSWAFFDCCQQLVPEVTNRLNAIKGLYVVDPDIQERANAPFNTLALAGSTFGGSAWAPREGAPFFTKALLRGLAGACVEARDGGWAVTAKSLADDLDLVANAALDYRTLEVQRVGTYGRGVLLKPEAPMIPVAVRTQFASDMVDAISVTAHAEEGDLHERGEAEETWRFDVPASAKTYRIRAMFPDHIEPYPDATFQAAPCAQIVELRR